MAEPGILVAIHIAGSSGQPQRSIGEAELVAGQGLRGDRYFKAPGVVSLIEQEAIDTFNADHGTEVTAPRTRRNLLTRGIRLNPLVGQRFMLGEVELEGMELCDPCSTLGNDLATDSVTPAQVVRGFVVSGGLRAYVRSSGTIRPGDTLRPV
ncbi:MAG: MOSC domain-containing protein [Pseudomonadota bacterium]